MAKLDSTCWTMIRAAAEGAESDRSTFAWRHGPAVRAYLGERWKSSPLVEAIDDAVQDVFVECFKRGGVLDRHAEITRGSFRSFFYGVVRNVALRFEGRKAREREAQPATEFDFDEVTGADEHLSEVFDRAWARSLLKEAVVRMGREALEADEAARERVRLLHHRFYDGMTIREVARRRKLDEQSAYREFQKALKEFKSVLREVVTFHCPDSPAQAEQEFDLLVSLFQ